MFLQQKKNNVPILFLIILFMLFIPIDMLNGELVRSKLPSLSAIYKLTILFFISFYLIKIKKELYILGLCLFIMLFLLVHTLILGEIAKAISGIDMLIRFNAIIIFFIFFKNLIKKDYIRYVFLIVKVSFFFLVFNIFLGAIGFGYGMYGGNSESAVGTRGLIYAGNEIGGALIVSGSLVMMQQLEEDKYKNFFIIGLILLITSAIMTSKLSLLGSIFVFFAFPILKAIKNIHNFKIPKKDFFYTQFFLVFVPFLAVLGIYYTLFESNLIVRLSYFYEKVDLITLIFSSRNIWAEEAYHAFINNYNTFEYIFGSGKDWWQFISEHKLVEIDFIDFLMSYGFLGIIITFGLLVFILFQIIYNKHLNPYSLYIIFMIILLFGMSSMAGHIFNSGTAGFLIAILLALGFYQKKEIKE